MDTQESTFSLPNVSVGPDPFSPETLDDDVAFLVVFFQRDHYCSNCREQVQAIDERIHDFRERGAEVASIVPEPRDRVAEWQEQYELSYPLLADPEAAVGDAYDQPVRFGPLGKLSDFFGRMPALVILDLRGDELEVAYTYRSSSTFDRPDLEGVRSELDELRAEPSA